MTFASLHMHFTCPEPSGDGAAELRISGLYLNRYTCMRACRVCVGILIRGLFCLRRCYSLLHIDRSLSSLAESDSTRSHTSPSGGHSIISQASTSGTNMISRSPLPRTRLCGTASMEPIMQGWFDTIRPQCERVRSVLCARWLSPEPTDHVRYRTCADGTVRPPHPSAGVGTWSPRTGAP